MDDTNYLPKDLTDGIKEMIKCYAHQVTYDDLNTMEESLNDFIYSVPWIFFRYGFSRVFGRTRECV